MFETPFLQLFILFFVIIDPLASIVVFVSATAGMKKQEKTKTALYAIGIAASISYLCLFFGQKLLTLFQIELNDFKVAGGIVLGLLAIKMIMGSSMEEQALKTKSAKAIASIIGTPLLTGPAAITAILISSQESGIASTGIAVTAVLLLTAIAFMFGNYIEKKLGKTTIQVISTLMGMVTLTWGIMFIKSGLGM